MLAKKLRCWHRYKSCSNDVTKAAYYKSFTDARSGIFNHHKHLEKKIIDCNNVGSFYKFANNKLSCTIGIGPIQNNDGTITNDDHEKSEMFNTYYSSVWTDDNGILPDFPRRVPNDTNIADIVFTSSNVLKQLKNLKVNSSAGPDGIKPIFIIILPTVWRIR